MSFPSRHPALRPDRVRHTARAARTALVSVAIAFASIALLWVAPVSSPAAERGPPAIPAATASVPAVPRAATFAEFWRSGKPLTHLRLRFEQADDDARRDSAHAATLRAALGFRTASLAGVFALAELEAIGAAGRYDDGGANRDMTRFTQIADPEGLEFDQALVGFNGLPHTVVQVGRQLVLDRDAPFHRFLGNVVWRQNWQTHDAVGLFNDSLPDTVLRAWYSWNLNRILGEDHPQRGFDDQGLNGYLFNAVHTGLSWGRVEAYAYLLDFEASALPAVRSFYPSTQTYGLRFDGHRPLRAGLDFLYVAEAAWQTDFADNPSGRIEAPFAWLMLGARWQPDAALPALTLKFSYEHLGGSGGADRFTTPLATGHAFQGWADRFLNTPGDGIRDAYVTTIVSVAGFAAQMDYHWFGSDHDGYAYGEELNVQLTRPLGGGVVAGLAYADYDADRNSRNVMRNSASGQAFDARRFWAWLEYRY